MSEKKTIDLISFLDQLASDLESYADSLAIGPQPPAPAEQARPKPKTEKNKELVEPTPLRPIKNK